MTSWVLISGDFSPLGGMDRANHALAAFLAQRGDRVTLVTHRGWPDLEAAGVSVHAVPRPFGSHLLGSPLLARAGERLARQAAPGTRVVANGGNADAGDIVWVHYLHAAYTAAGGGGAVRRFRVQRANEYYLRREAQAIGRARIVVCNSRRTARDVQRAYGLPIERLPVVYYGVDAKTFALVSDEARALARRALGWSDTPVALFVGALGDRRKGFDRLFEAWRLLTRDPQWDVALAVAGEGAAVDGWQARAERDGVRGLRFLGFRRDIAEVMAACDVLVHPARYEAYGLGVHEAICRGLPAIVSREAGVAEVFPPDLRDLLIDDVESADEIAQRLRRWREGAAGLRSRMQTFAHTLRGRSWMDMGREFTAAVGA